MEHNLGCKYQKSAGCSKCTFTIYKKCNLFRTWHAKWLLQDILPMTVIKSKPLSPNIYYTRDAGLARQLVASSSLFYNKKLKYLTFSQIVSLFCDSDRNVDNRVIFIECLSRVPQESNSIVAFNSFLEKLMIDKRVIVIYVKPNTIPVNQSWIKLD